jgi:hypothetical protein
MNSYDIHKKIIDDGGYNPYKTTKEIFGRKIKERKFKKWFARDTNERKKRIRRYGIEITRQYNFYFGCKVFTYNSIFICAPTTTFTCKPKSNHARPCTLNYARILSRWGSIDCLLPF